MAVTNTSFSLRNFKLAEPGRDTNLVELAHLAVTGVSADAVARQAEIGSVSVDGGRLYLLRTANTTANVMPPTPPRRPNRRKRPPTRRAASRHCWGSITNAVARLLQTTNLCTGLVRDVEFTHCAFHLEDLTASRPARLDLDDITVSVKNISNVPGTNLTVGLSLRWNTNGAIKTDVALSLAPLTADVQFALDRLDLGTLDPYLESKLNLFIPGSQFGLHGQVQVRTPAGQLPEIGFRGDTWLDGLRVVDGAIGEDLLKWNSVRVSGIEANVNPLSANIREIALDNVAAHVVIETNHTINLLAALTPVGATNAPADTNAAATVAKNRRGPQPTALAPAGLPPFSIGSIVISNDSASFTDRSLTPNVNVAVLEAGGTIAGISSSQLQHADVNLSAKVDGVGPVAIVGTLNPFSGTETNDMKITVKDMDLTPTSPYSGKFAGYRIARGKLNLDLAYDLVGRKLKSKNVITLDRFTFGEKVESPDATHLPVRLAIALLKDRNGQILLDVPVEGSLDDPQFRIGKVVVHTLLNILEKAATSPFSLLGALVGRWRGTRLSGFRAGQRGVVARQPEETGFAGQGALRTSRPATRNRRQHRSRDRPGRPAPRQPGTTNPHPHLDVAAQIGTRHDHARPVDADAGGIHGLGEETLQRGCRQRRHQPGLHRRPHQSRRRRRATQTALRLRRTKAQPCRCKVPDPAAIQIVPGRHAAAPARPVPAGDPMETLLKATIPIADADFQALAAERAKAVRAYLLQTGKVEAERLFLAENKTGGVQIRRQPGLFAVPVGRSKR